MASSSLRYVAPAVLVLLGSAPASAQNLPGGTMPPPPSASDPLPRTTAEKPGTGKRPVPKRAQGTGGVSASSDDVSRSPAKRRATPAQAAAGDDYTTRIDPRQPQGSRRLELEDDPRAVRPILQGGRPGVGMRF